MGNILRFFLPLRSPPQSVQSQPQLPTFSQLALQAARRGDVGGLESLVMKEGGEVVGRMPLSQVADPDTGTTLLHVAMGRGHIPLTTFLILAGCDLTMGDHSGETPLHAACMGDRVDVLRTAVDLVKVDLEVRDRWKRTLLLKAMAYNSESVLRFLLSRDVNLNAQDSFHLSVMHMAAVRHRLDMVRDLAGRGADLNLLQDNCRSALSLAVTGRMPAMVRELLVQGASTCTLSCHTLPCNSAMKEFVHRVEGGLVCTASEEILHLMLAAHGYLLHADELNVFQRVLYTADAQRFLPLRHKLVVCSNSLSDDLHNQSPRTARPKTRTPLRLFDLARRSARKALMASGCNVLWAVERLSSSLPPAVKGLLLLKDCDFKDFPGRY